MDIVERLKLHRVILKSGDYDGAQLMQAWCAMIDAADEIQSLRDQNADLERRLAVARSDAVEECAKVADNHAFNAWHIAEAEGQNSACASGRNYGGRAIAKAIRSLSEPVERGE